MFLKTGIFANEALWKRDGPIYYGFRRDFIR